MQNKARPLAEVLPVMLLPFRLTSIVRDDVLLITSVTEVESSPETRVYFPRGEQDLSALREEIKARFGPRFACRMITPGVLLVRETYWGHSAIEKEYGDKLDFIRPARTTIVPGVVPERLNLALNQSTPVSFLDTPLHQVGDFLAASGKIGITFDSQALAEIGMSEDVPVTLNLKYSRLRCVFDVLLRDLDLAWIPNETGIIITTPDEAGRKIEIDYGVRGLSQDPFCADLIEAIKSTVAPQTWHYHKTSIALNRERNKLSPSEQ